MLTLFQLFCLCNVTVVTSTTDPLQYFLPANLFGLNVFNVQIKFATKLLLLAGMQLFKSQDILCRVTSNVKVNALHYVWKSSIES